MEELFRSMAKRERQANLSFFAFTATPNAPVRGVAFCGSDGALRNAELREYRLSYN
jgi:hypothetical protein